MSSQNWLSIPAPRASHVWLRLSPLPRSGDWKPTSWRHEPLSGGSDGWWKINLAALNLADGAYEYEFVVERNNGTFTAPDPYAEELTKFSGYRSVLRMQAGQRWHIPFSWEGEMPDSGSLPNNNEIVIYELPMRWVDPGDNGYDRQVGLGTFEKARFERLEQTIASLGVNCIELLPIQDSADTLNWGYGTRFFFAPDLDMGEAFDLKLLVKACHRLGIRVIFDLVMNHARTCPLENLAFDWFFLADLNEEPGPGKDEKRPDWGGKAFRYRKPVNNTFYARQFHYDVAEFLIRNYHIDGFRLDEFKGINNYDFIQDFTRHAHAIHGSLFPGRPFLVIAEDSWQRAAITNTTHRGERVVDSMWDFNFRNEVRQLVSNTMWTKFGERSRRDRVRKILTVRDSVLAGGADDTFWDMDRRVTYCTSHDVEGDDEQRLYSYFLAKRRLPVPGLGSDVDTVTQEQIVSTFAFTLTAAGIPMFLAGEEFADRHDLPRDARYKMSDPVDWVRLQESGRTHIRERVRQLVALRTSHPSLRRNELQFFGFGSSGFHPTFDGVSSGGDGERLFAYCRTGGKKLGETGQVIIISNCSDRVYPEVWLDWPWGFQPSLQEHGGQGQSYPFVMNGKAKLALAPFQTRSFSV